MTRNRRYQLLTEFGAPSMSVGLYVFTATMAAQSSRTYGLMNGRAWRGMSHDARVFYLEGINATIVATGQFMLGTPCQETGLRMTSAYEVKGLTQGKSSKQSTSFTSSPRIC